ncbi:hypothetical protein GCM10007385_43360 [Tateyamaria omphalii]|nr:hypothetical protein GCM10007385_43360 [Tateyamaria omphalii]
MDGQVIAVIGTANRAKDAVEIADTRQSAKRLKRLLVRFENVTKLDTIVPLTDWPAAAGRPCSC